MKGHTDKSKPKASSRDVNLLPPVPIHSRQCNEHTGFNHEVSIIYRSLLLTPRALHHKTKQRFSDQEGRRLFVFYKAMLLKKL